MARPKLVLLSDLEPGMKVSGYVHSCAICETMFIASVDARFCCEACRMKFKRRK